MNDTAVPELSSEMENLERLLQSFVDEYEQLRASGLTMRQSVERICVAILYNCQQGVLD